MIKVMDFLEKKENVSSNLVVLACSEKVFTVAFSLMHPVPNHQKVNNKSVYEQDFSKQTLLS